MTLFLRTQENKSLIEIEVFEKDDHIDLSAAIYLQNYSEWLLSNNLDVQKQIIEDFDDLMEIRGWLWEQQEIENEPVNFEKIRKAVQKWMEEIRDRYGLYYVED